MLSSDLVFPNLLEYIFYVSFLNIKRVCQTTSIPRPLFSVLTKDFNLASYIKKIIYYDTKQIVSLDSFTSILEAGDNFSSELKQK